MDSCFPVQTSAVHKVRVCPSNPGKIWGCSWFCCFLSARNSLGSVLLLRVYALINLIQQFQLHKQGVTFPSFLLACSVSRGHSELLVWLRFWFFPFPYFLFFHLVWPFAMGYFLHKALGLLAERDADCPARCPAWQTEPLSVSRWFSSWLWCCRCCRCPGVALLSLSGRAGPSPGFLGAQVGQNSLSLRQGAKPSTQNITAPAGWTGLWV